MPSLHIDPHDGVTGARDQGLEMGQCALEARAELDNNKRKEMYYECQAILRDEGGVVVPFFADWVNAASDKCGYENVAGDWKPDGAKAAERWWFK